MTKTNAQTKTARATAKAKLANAKLPGDAIIRVGPYNLNADVEVVANDGRRITIKHKDFTAAMGRRADIGHSMDELAAYIAGTAPKLATGVDGRTSPHSAKAVADRKSTARASNKADAAQAAGKAKSDAKSAAKARQAAAKAERAAKRLIPDETKITVVAKENPYREGTKAAATYELFRKSKTVAEFKAHVAKAPGNYDPGYIRYSSRDGHIKLS